MDFKQEFSRQITKINMKTSTFMEENKIRTYITTLENDIMELKRRSGELGYQLWMDGQFDVSKLEPMYQEIAEKYCLIQEQERLIVELQEKNRQVLGTNPAPAAQGAPGQGMPGAAPVQGMPGAAPGNVCPKCGEVCAPNVNFCKRCGTRLHG
ncbi:MAG: zinc ribbon domain-containing protein [Lachnospiraceae bacterium]|nr:zinc ribbon domain-containing protein [Lachnospiraceae bacterium]